ncbi:hypothetical protein BN1708_012622 [Verticillium longisporum]|uniref:Uncharacterized protein n=1 Tax=Verticillium longisporum TaxID=100787 RepID=A0A0G4LCG7_VERLO|nr:hypothetical protein BN1708_012622 [Verticillium longisporum]
MSSDEQTKICLGVAVDHRIQRLCKTTPHGLAGESDHVASIKEEGRALRRPREEIAVTAELAGPAYKGGIAVMLQQPRKTHPYDKGIDAVIEDCESLLALYEAVWQSSTAAELRAGRAWVSGDDVDVLELPLARAAEMVLASMHEVLTKTAEGMGAAGQGETDEKKAHLVKSRRAELKLVRNLASLREPTVALKAKRI